MTAASPLVWTYGVDPVMLRESLGLTRRWQSYVFRALYVGLLTLAVWLVWSGFAESAVPDYTVYARFGQRLFSTFGWAQCFLITTLALGTGSDMLSKEIRDGTLSLLAATPLSAWQIVLGKWKSCMAHQAILLLSGVPLLSLSLYFGGVGAESLIAVTALTVATAAVASAMTISLSIRIQSPLATMAAGVLFLGASAVFPPLCWFHPISALFGVLTGGSLPTIEFFWILSVAGSFLAALFILQNAARTLQGLMWGEPRAPRPWSPRPRTAVPSGSDPVLWRELRRAPSAHRTVIRTLVIVAVVATVLLDFAAGTPELVVAVTALLIGLATIAAMAAGSGAIAKEREGKRLEMLLVTPMTAGEILQGKFLGSLVPVAPYAGALTAFVLLEVLAASRFVLLQVLAVTAASLLSTTSIALFISLCARTSSRAFSLTLVTMLFMLVALPSLAAVIPEATRFKGAGGTWDSLVAITNPFIYLSGVRRGVLHEHADFAGFCLLHFMASGVVLAACRLGFNRLAGRAS